MVTFGQFRMERWLCVRCDYRKNILKTVTEAKGKYKDVQFTDSDLESFMSILKMKNVNEL